MCAAPPQKSRVQGRRHACVWECIATATGTREVERPIRLLITSHQSTTARPIEVEWLESLHPQPRRHLQGLESHGMHHLLTRGAERAGRDALDAWKGRHGMLTTSNTGQIRQAGSGRQSP